MSVANASATRVVVCKNTITVNIVEELLPGEQKLLDKTVIIINNYYCCYYIIIVIVWNSLHISS